MKVELYSNSEKETLELASHIGRLVRGGECFEFISDLGGGKTTFIRGLVGGMGSLDTVNSPSFTIGKQYKVGDKTIFHYDFYRLGEAGVVKEELSEALADQNNVILVEWAETVRDVLPDPRIVVQISKVSDSFEGRKIAIEFNNDTEYLLEDLK